MQKLLNRKFVKSDMYGQIKITLLTPSEWMVVV